MLSRVKEEINFKGEALINELHTFEMDGPQGETSLRDQSEITDVLYNITKQERDCNIEDKKQVENAIFLSAVKVEEENIFINGNSSLILPSVKEESDINYNEVENNVGKHNQDGYPITSCINNSKTLDMENKTFDSINFLKNNPLSSLTFQEKCSIKQKISRPILKLSQKDGYATRVFQNKWYLTYRWLSGCEQTKTLHCYYCLMFDGDEPWAHTGIKTIKNFEARARKHAQSKSHIKNAEKFHMLGRNRIDNCLAESARSEALRHNQNVQQNRRIVSRLIDVVCYLGRQELPFRECQEESSSLNRGNYLEMLNLLAMEEAFMKDHLKVSTVFKGTSREIQNDLIEAVTTAIIEKIVEELEKAEFVAIQVDETTDVSVKAQLNVIVRYVYDSRIKERFLGFFDVSLDKSAEGLASHILAVLEKYNLKEKLVSQTYDGATIMAGCHKGVQAIIREYCPMAIFVHCYAHQLNLALLHGAKTIKEVKLFICNMRAFHVFFSQSGICSEVLRERGFKLPHPAATRWNYNSRGVATIKEHYSELKNAVSYIIDSDEWDPDSTNSAIGLERILNSPSFLFLLCLYYRIFMFTEHLFNMLQAKTTSDVNMCIEEIRQTKRNISSLRSENILQSCIDECHQMNPEINPETFSSSQKRLAFEVIDSVIVQLDRRFSDFCDLTFFELLNHQKFVKYKHSFPDECFKKLTTIFPNKFISSSLKNELINIYSSEEKVMEAPQLLAYILENELESVYEQTVKLLKLVLTIPVTSPFTENSMSTLKLIKTHLQNSMTNVRLSNLATLSIEKELCHECSRNPEFKERVIDIFAHMKCRTELIYKKVK